jgi:hypothetical protein
MNTDLVDICLEEADEATPPEDKSQVSTPIRVMNDIAETSGKYEEHQSQGGHSTPLREREDMDWVSSEKHDTDRT